MSDDKSITFETISSFLQWVEETCRERTIFRGQSDANAGLLPGIARDRNKNGKSIKFDPREIEKEMVNELKREGAIFGETNMNEIELLVCAQHYGLETRLMDWTTNPLIALWFACQEHYDSKKCETAGKLFVYPFKETKVKENIENPFELTTTTIYFSKMNNPRIIAQDGCFTVHPFNEEKRRFVDFEKNKRFSPKITVFEIASDKKKYIIEQLDRLGVNEKKLFPDFEGLCRYLKSKFRQRIARAQKRKC